MLCYYSFARASNVVVVSKLKEEKTRVDTFVAYLPVPRRFGALLPSRFPRRSRRRRFPPRSFPRRRRELSSSSSPSFPTRLCHLLGMGRSTTTTRTQSSTARKACATSTAARNPSGVAQSLPQKRLYIPRECFFVVRRRFDKSGSTKSNQRAAGFYYGEKKRTSR